MTRVVVPHVGVIPMAVVTALDRARSGWQPVDVSESDDAYFELISDLWGETFALVEHDVVVNPDTLASFDDCEAEWCVSKYDYLGGSYWGLGCTRFRSSLARRHPDLMEAVGRYEVAEHPPRHWCSLDAAITKALRARRVDWPHVHGTVTHLGDNWPSHGCRHRPGS